LLPLGALVIALPAAAQTAEPDRPQTQTETDAMIGGPDPAPQESQAEREARERRERRERDAAAEEEEERSTIFWVTAGAGASYADAIVFDRTNFVPGAERQNGMGPSIAAAAGVKLFILTLGARATISFLPPFDVGTIALDVGVRIPTPIVEPYARIGFGYAWLGAADYQMPSMSDTSVYGLVLDAGVGFDFYLSDNFAIGAGFDFAFLNLSRQQDDTCTSMCTIADVNFEEDGDAAGLQVRLFANARFEI
jgi:hypothetical protein